MRSSRRSLRRCSVNSSKSRVVKILLDTTYLLPVVGIDVEGIERPLTILKKLREEGKIEVYYTPFSILEILGKLSKIDFDRERVEMGLKAIRESFRVTHPTVKGYMKALKLRRKGFRDLIDLLLYTTSRTRRLNFLTRDRDLIEFLKKVGEDVDNVVYEEELEKFVEKHVDA